MRVLVLCGLLVLSSNAKAELFRRNRSNTRPAQPQTQTQPQTAKTTSGAQSQPIGEVSYNALPGRAVGRLVADRFGVFCTAFLTGTDIITTDAHCIATGIDGMKFRLHNRGDKYTAEANLTHVYTMGGGVGEGDDGMDGTDWAHVRIDKPLGAQYGYLPLAEVSDVIGLPITVVGFGTKWYDGKYAGHSKCKAEAPPEQHRKYCKDLGNGEYLCNFFSHSCWVDPSGGGSGGPVTAVIDGKEQVVGIQLGVSKIGVRAFNPATTTSDTEPEAANVHFHWLNMTVYSQMEKLTKEVGTLRFNTELSAAHDLEHAVRSLRDDWVYLNVGQRFGRIQEWSTFEGQKGAIQVLASYRKGSVSPDGNSFIAKVDTSALPGEFKKPGMNYGRFYIASHVSPIAPLNYPTLSVLSKSELNALYSTTTGTLYDAKYEKYTKGLLASISAENNRRDNIERDLQIAEQQKRRNEQQRIAEYNENVRKRNAIIDEINAIKRELAAIQNARQTVQRTYGTQQQTYVQPQVQYYTVPAQQYYLVPVQVVPVQVVPVQVVPVYGGYGGGVIWVR